VHCNLSSLIKNADVASREQVEGILWLYKMYVGTYNDKEDVISKFDAFSYKLQQKDVSPKAMLFLM
jgi:hypothetical protein